MCYNLRISLKNNLTLYSVSIEANHMSLHPLVLPYIKGVIAKCKAQCIIIAEQIKTPYSLVSR